MAVLPGWSTSPHSPRTTARRRQSLQDRFPRTEIFSHTEIGRARLDAPGRRRVLRGRPPPSEFLVHKFLDPRAGRNDAVLSLHTAGDPSGLLTVACCAQHLVDGRGEASLSEVLSRNHFGDRQSRGSGRYSGLVAIPWYQHHGHAVVETFHHNPVSGVADEKARPL